MDIYILSVFITILLTSTFLNTTPLAELRAYVHNIETTKNNLANMGATLKSEYAFTDYIYHPKNSFFNLNNEFVRLRAYEKTMWQQKLFIVVHKVNRAIILHKEFDTLYAAQEFLEKKYRYAFSFFRSGLEYQLDNAQLFLENIESIESSIEVIARNEALIYTLLNALSITAIITDSMPRLIEKQKYTKEALCN